MENTINLSRIQGDLKGSSTQSIEHTYNNSLVAELKFVNLSQEPIVVCFRDGSYSILRSSFTSAEANTLIIGYKKTNMLSPINTIEGEECQITNLVRTELIKSDYHRAYVEEVISIDKLKRSRTGFYVDNADVVIALVNQLKEIPHHPFSKQRIHNLYLNAADDFDPTIDINVTIRYVRNEGIIKRLYGIFHNRVIVLNGKVSNTLETGVYIAGLNELDINDTNSIRQDKFYSLQAIEEGTANCPITLFKSLEEAQFYLRESIINNSHEEIAKREHEKDLLKMKQEYQLKEQELKHIEQENNKLKIDKTLAQELLQEKLAELERKEKQEKLESELKAQQYKEEVSRKTNETKLLTETIKVVGLGLGFLFTVYKLIA